MPIYYRTPSMQTGIGFICPACEIDIKSVGFRCPNCNKYLMHKVDTHSSVEVFCPRCKAVVRLMVYEYSEDGKKRGMYVKANSPYSVDLKCKRCKTSVSVRVREALPWIMKKKESVKEKSLEATV